MTTWFECQEKLWRHVPYIQWRLDGEPNHLEASEDAKPPRLSLTSSPSAKGVSLLRLIQDYGATDFSDAFAWYWVKLTQPGLCLGQTENMANNFYLPFQKVFHLSQSQISQYQP